MKPAPPRTAPLPPSPDRRVVERIESRFFEARSRFPAGAIEFDCGLLMRGLRHEWRAVPPLARKEAV